MPFLKCLAGFVISLLCMVGSGCSNINKHYQHLQTPIKSYTVNSSPRIVLVLGGGGAKGLAHLGALSVLEEEGIKPDLIIGSSAGSIIGALYADHPNANELAQRLVHAKQKDLMQIDYLSFIRMLWQLDGLNDGKALTKYMQRHLKAKNFNQLKIPLVVVTTDLLHNMPFLIGSGEILPAIHASSAVPFVFTPVKLYGRVLVDGGVISPLPVEIAQSFHPRLVIAIDVGAPPPASMPPGNLSLLYQSAWITYDALASRQRMLADVVIRPNTEKMGMFVDDQNEKLVKLGREAARAALPTLRKRLSKLEETVSN